MLRGAGLNAGGADDGAGHGGAPAVAIRELGARVGGAVRLRGWLQGKRSGGKVAFLQVRDGTGVCQCVAEAAAGAAFEAACDITLESSLTVDGVVRADPRAPGGVELAVTGLTILQRADDYPITRKAHGIDFLLSHRHLWLRSRRPSILLRVRHTIEKACRDYFDEDGFTLVDTPILVPGAGEDRQSLFSVDYFGQPLYLAQTGQLYLECACMALGRVYCFGPTFRAEKSKTRRHLTEFWMVEPEIAFAELPQVMDLAEGLILRIVRDVLARHRDDLVALGRDPAPLEALCGPFPRITYTEAVDLLRSAETRERLEAELAADRVRLESMRSALAAAESEAAGTHKEWRRDALQAQVLALREEVRDLERDIEARPEHIRLAQSFAWGKDLGGSDETIVSRHFDRPVFVTDYPREAKAFYMKRQQPGDRTVRNMDLLAPEGFGEIIGGSQREDDLDVLVARMREEGLQPEDYEWYLDLRRYGSVPHGGFGLGIERTLSWICGVRHVRETIAFPRLMGRVYP